MLVSMVTEEVVSRLLDGQVGAIFQGRPEMGARALGNRSIIFDPRVPEGKDIVNRVKQREWFRPFAASVLFEYAPEWFVMGPLKSSPLMLFALPTQPDKIAEIPAVVHVDGTCRAQTVAKDQNPKWYELIEAFGNETGVPLLLNTSFNLAGDPLVHTEEDALATLRKSQLEFIYFADRGEVVTG